MHARKHGRNTAKYQFTKQLFVCPFLKVLVLAVVIAGRI